MPQETEEVLKKTVDDLMQLAAVLGQFRSSCSNVKDGSALLYLHRAAGLMEVVVHDLNSVAGELADRFQVPIEPVPTDWPPMAREHGLGHKLVDPANYPGGEGCCCGSGNHDQKD